MRIIELTHKFVQTVVNEEEIPGGAKIVWCIVGVIVVVASLSMVHAVESLKKFFSE